MAAIAILIAIGCLDPARGQSKAFAPTVELRNAGANKWRSIGPEGGPIAALSVDPRSGEIFAAISGLALGIPVATPFHSVNRAARWMPSGAPNGVLIFDPANASTIYDLDQSSAVSKSIDGGVTWFPLNSRLPNTSALAIDPLNTSTLYAGTDDGVFKSTDAGANWNPSNAGLPPPNQIGHYPQVFGLAIDPQNPSTLYAVVDHPNAPGELLFKSTDGAASWSQVGSGLPESSIILAIDPQNPSTLYAGTGKGVFKSTNGGQDWNSASAGLPPFPVEPYVVADFLAIDPRAPTNLYVAVGNLLGGRIFKSTNGGGSWSEAGAGLPAGTTIGPVLFDVADSATLYAGTGVGVYKTADGGVSWAAANSGLTETRIFDVAVDPENSNTLYAGTSMGLVKTTDGGTNWSLASSGLAGSGFPIAIDPQNTSTVFTGGCSPSHVCGIAKTTDGGTSWSVTQFFPDPIDGSISAIALDPQNSNIVYAATTNDCDDDLYKSVDGGVSWAASQFADIGASGGCVLTLAVDPQNPANLYATFLSGGVFKSTDAGATWNAANSGLSSGSSFYSAAAFAIDPTSPRTVYTVSSAGVFKSSDGGMNWNPASAGLPDWSSEWGNVPWGNVLPRLAIDPQDPARIYLGMAINAVYHVFQSSDGGGSWADSGFPVSHCLGICGLAVSSQGWSTAYAGTSDAGLFALRRP